MKTNKRYGWSILAAATVGLLVGTADMTAQGMRLERAVVANAGGTISDGTITMQYTVGQPVVGTATNGTMTGTFGFWSDALQVSSVDGGIIVGAITALSVTPNPLAGDGTVNIALARSGPVEVLLYDAAGQIVERLFDGTRPAGSFSVAIDASGLASGAYFVAARVPGSMVQTPITVTK